MNRSETVRAVRPERQSPAATGAARPRVSLRWILPAVACALMTGSILLLGAVVQRGVRTLLTEEIESRLVLQAQNLSQQSSSALLSEFPELSLYPFAQAMIERQPEIAFVTVTDEAGDIVGDGQAARIGQRLELPDGLVPLPYRSRLEREGLGRHPSAARPETARLLGNRDLIVATAPAKLAGHRELGTVYIGLKRAYIEERIGYLRRIGWILFSAVLVLCVFATYLMTRKLLEPIGSLRAGIERIGRGDLDTPIVVHDRSELGMLADALNTMSWELTAARETLIHSERLDHEMDLAQEIQRSLLPAARQRVGGIAFEGVQRAATEVGGDYYDILPLPDGRVGVAIADVSGKGLAGCMVTTMVSALLTAYSKVHVEPSALLGALDECLADLLPPATFVTMFYGVVDPVRGTIVYASAGHTPGFLYRRRDRSVVSLGEHGAPLCLVRRGDRVRRTLRDTTAQLEPGDLVLLFTDGVNEAFDSAGTQFGFERVQEIVRRAAPGGAETVLPAFRSALDEWRAGAPLSDDETLVVLSRATAQEEPMTVPSDPAEAPEALVIEARREGVGMQMRGRLEELERLGPWLQTLAPLGDLDETTFQGVQLALYELCANIIEHGQHDWPPSDVTLWWVPTRHHFLIVDQGRPFAPPPWKPTDYGDARVRRRGRGHGLDIVRRLAAVHFHPSSPVGNVTRLDLRIRGIHPHQEEIAS